MPAGRLALRAATAALAIPRPGIGTLRLLQRYKDGERVEGTTVTAVRASLRHLEVPWLARQLVRAARPGAGLALRALRRPRKTGAYNVTDISMLSFRSNTAQKTMI
eukprot:3583217-Pleurochrysis_carterae.AAC.2